MISLHSTTPFFFPPSSGDATFPCITRFMHYDDLNKVTYMDVGNMLLHAAPLVARMARAKAKVMIPSSTSVTSLSSHASLPVGRQSLGYLQEGKLVDSPSNQSSGSLSNVVKKMEAMREKVAEKVQLDEPLEKEKGAVGVIHRPEKIWHGRCATSSRGEIK
ncbi:hypothetical protein BDQ12DRAFT_668796 [Crucibulum laeve]|uniref:Uncharacterized protein n=1 Tax=Crucibulum laeve TaxID=68775 RepID=A0A5C3LPP3_9AGAR|nr:hypothetical protein BDQ12DRAFT_668796 [Crucibulum laeve]